MARPAAMSSVVAVVLAGGLARRLGGRDKALRLLHGRTLLDHVLARIRPQVAAIALSANGDPARFAAYGLPVLADSVPENPGPLAGILAGMHWARRAHPEYPLLLSVPTDAPFLPADLVFRLLRARESAGVVCAASLGRRHPVVALWPAAMADALADALAEGVRGVEVFAARHGLTAVEFPAAEVDPFLNINSAADLDEAARFVG